MNEESETDMQEMPLGYTYDSLGNVLSLKREDNCWRVYTRDRFGNVLSFKNSYGYWYIYTRDSLGNELSYKRSDGFGGTLIGKLDNYNLYWDQDNDTFSGGCRNQLSREEALEHWDRDDDRAILATLLILTTGEFKAQGADN